MSPSPSSLITYTNRRTGRVTTAKVLRRGRCIARADIHVSGRWSIKGWPHHGGPDVRKEELGEEEAMNWIRAVAVLEMYTEACATT